MAVLFPPLAGGTMHVHVPHRLLPLRPAPPKPHHHHNAAQLRFTVSASSSAAPPPAHKPQAVIVGGGLAGLAAATHLTSLSVPFTLIEASDRVGGRVATDKLDGFRLDRGFQIFLTAYPECRRLLDYQSLRLKPFYPGALVFVGPTAPGNDEPAFHLLSDPFRRPLRSLPALLSPVGTVPDKLLVGLARLRAAATPDDDILAAPETTTAEHLQRLGFSPSIIERFLRPFLAGIFFDPKLDTSSRLFELVFKRLALGDNALPEDGIAAIATQLEARLPPSSIRLNTRVTAIDQSLVTLDTGETVPGELGVIVAVDQPEAHNLLPQLLPSNPPRKSSERSTVCIYFSADRAPIQDPVLLLNGSGKGIVNNMFFASSVAPSYAPPGKVLVSVSLVGSLADRADDAALAEEVVRELAGWFGAEEVAAWRHLRTYRIGFAQPDQTPPTVPAGREPRVGEGVYVCGDHWCSATFDGAMVSGRRAAEALVKDRGLGSS